MDIEQRPLFLVNTTMDIKICSWSKFETYMNVLFDVSASYLNTQHLYWEPFVQFLMEPSNKFKRNLKLKYTESSLIECSLNPAVENIIGSTPKNLKFHCLDEINFTLSEQFFRSFKIIYDDILCTNPELKPHNLYESQFSLINNTLYNMEIILFDGSRKGEKRIFYLQPMESTNFTASKINFDDIVKDDNIVTPSFFQRIPDTSIKIFLTLNKSSVSHYYFSEMNQIYSYVVDTKITNRVYSICFRYPFKILNLLEVSLHFKAKCRNTTNPCTTQIEPKQHEYVFLGFYGDFDFSLSAKREISMPKMKVNFSDTEFPLKYKYTLTNEDGSKIQCICFLSFDEISCCTSTTLKDIHKPMSMIISPAITVQNNLSYPMDITMIFDNKSFIYKIAEYGTCDVLQLSEKRLKFTIQFCINLIELEWKASVDFDLSSKQEKHLVRFMPNKKGLVHSIGFTVEKKFGTNFLVNITSQYTIVNSTKHNINIKLIKKMIGKDEIICIPSKSTLPFSPSVDCEKANISIDDFQYSDSFPLNAIGFHGNLKIKKNGGTSLYHYVMVSIKRMNNVSIKIEFKSAVFFKNNLNHMMQIIPKHCDIIHSIYMDKRSETRAVLPLPELPCDFTIYLENHDKKQPIQYHSIINKNSILYCPYYLLYFSAKCYWKDSILHFVFDELKPESFDYILINYSKITLYCHHDYKTTCLMPFQQVYFSTSCTGDASVDAKFSFKTVIDSKNPPLDFEKFQDKISTLEVDGTTVYIAKFYEVRHTAFVLTQDYNFALHCSDIVNESTWLSCYFKISGLSVSFVSCLLGKELLVLSIFKNSNRWFIQGDESEAVQLTTKFCKHLDRAFTKYLISKSCNKVDLAPKKSVNFDEMKYYEDKTSLKLNFRSSYGIHLILNLSVSMEIQNISFKVDKIQIDCPAFECTNPVILCQTSHAPTIAIPDTSVYSFIVASMFINRPVNYQNLGHRKYQNLDYLKILIQEFDISIDIPFLLTLANYFDYIFYLLDMASGDSSSMEPKKKTEQKYFVKYYHLSPLKFNINIITASFNEKTPRIELPDSANKLTYFNLLTLMLMHMPLIDISKTSLHFPCLNIENMDALMSMSDLMEKSSDHYYFYMKKRFIKLIFNLKVTGNIVSTASSFAHGIKSFFYEPYQGAVRSNQFEKGVVLGFKGLYSGTIGPCILNVGTAATALTSIGDTIGKGLATLSFDPSYEDYRNKILKIREHDPLKGLVVGGLGVLRGFGSGVAGLVTSPVEAFQEKKEVADIFKGVGKGIVGLFTKPLGGIVDFTSSGLNLISKASDTEGPVKQRRNERCFYYDDIIRLIDFDEIKKYHLFMSLKKSNRFLSDDKFVHAQFRDRLYAVITDRRVLVSQIDSLFECEIIASVELMSIFKVGRKEHMVNVHFYQSSHSEKNRSVDTISIRMDTPEVASEFIEYLSRFICPV
ncbi:Vacuolar protein sorting-associated protein 13A [Thelohanellus kitauei]|uniref:Vacuolar protein sorting-associated protein 13A n=1 Tax=Thelohanellus kitauei TaxID=669202 RepID=A0A0C2M1A1_THEKT|nr:Vacuolar protein sorting-associated protein 13A [Thelohanellus kitauei]